MSVVVVYKSRRSFLYLFYRFDLFLVWWIPKRACIYHCRSNYCIYTVKMPYDPGFQVRGAHLKKWRRAVFRVKNHDFTPKNHIFSNCGGRRENIWGISCEKSRFYAPGFVWEVGSFKHLPSSVTRVHVTRASPPLVSYGTGFFLIVIRATVCVNLKGTSI